VFSLVIGLSIEEPGNYRTAA